MKTVLALFLFSGALLGLGLLAGEERPAALRHMDNRWVSTHPLASTGPVKGLLIDLWWIRVQALQQAYRFDEVGTLAERISFLQPFIPFVWETMSWNMAFNLLAESAPERDKQVQWLERGIRLLHDGLAYNKEHPRLRFFLGWTVYMKTRGEEPFTRELHAFLGEEPLRYAYRQVRASDPLGRKVYLESIFLLQLARFCGETEDFGRILAGLLEAFPQYGPDIHEMARELDHDE